MNSNQRRFAITGVTGLLGRNLLFEIIKNHLSQLDKLEIFVLGRRAKSGLSLKRRLHDILLADGVEYLEIGKQDRNSFMRNMSAAITCLEMDLDSGIPHLAHDDLEALQRNPLDTFFHVAGLTDLRSTPAAFTALRRTNVEGTRQILKLASHLQVREFCYVGTAYACGSASGELQPDYLNASETFRSQYEKSKADAELLVRQFARRTGIRCRYFRPSTICGRLLEPPLGAVSSFDVFYSWPAFFLRLKQQDAAASQTPGRREMNVRVCYKRTSGLNVVPVDYVAKVMYLICEQNHPGESYHVVNNAESPHEFYIPQMLGALGVGGVTQVDRIPQDQNATEKLYYRSVGSLYTPYITCDPMCFDTSNIHQLLNQFDLRCPALDERAIGVLMEYAKERNFGVRARQG